MADHMLSVEEAIKYGIPTDPLEFVDATHRLEAEWDKYRKLEERESRWFESRWYFVQVIEMNGWTWLSIRRNDRKAIRDWRHMQQIKNALAGPEREGVEIYPAESRLHDTSNQYHLFVLPEGEQLPFGYVGRSVVTAAENDSLGMASVQRPFDGEEDMPIREPKELLGDLTTKVRIPDEPT